jgi:D-alanine-D-alanine ligase
MNPGPARRVAVLMGGFSSERAVSLKSGLAVATALREAGHEAVPYDVTGPSLPGLASMRPEVAFIALHGAFGEDGTLQQMLDDMRIPYTGSGPRASRLGMDKLASKRAFIRHAIPTADYVVVEPGTDAASVCRQAEGFGYPVVCKPAAGGSSLGVSIVREPARLPEALEAARAESGSVLVERYVRGREFTVGILEGEALPMIELCVAREFFDYQAKYEDERTRYVTPVALLPSIYRKACKAVVRAYHALGCRHMARVDLIYGYDGGLCVLEVNTIPGLTPRSLLPMAAAEAGLSFPLLCDTIVQAALRDAEEAVRRRRMIA